jgi:hypothetical protein
MNTYFLGLLEGSRRRKVLKLPFSFGALKFEEDKYYLFSIKVSIYEIFISIEALRLKTMLWWVVLFNEEWKEKSLISVEDVQQLYEKPDLDKNLKYPFPGRNILLRIDDNLIFHLNSFLNLEFHNNSWL